MQYEQDMQQVRNLISNYNKLSDETRDKLANGVEWLAFLQTMASQNDEREQSAPTESPAA